MNIIEAIKRNDLEEVKKIISREDFNIDAKGKDDRTPLHTASSEWKCDDIITLLLENGADVNAKANEDLTPLHIACRLGNLGSIKILLKHGADIYAKSRYRNRPIDEARHRDYNNIVNYLNWSTDWDNCD